MSTGIQPEPGNDSLAEQAYRLLEEQLVTLKLSPGKLITEKSLMDKAGIGRTPVREAIQRLSAEGPVSYTHLTLPTNIIRCSSRWWGYG